MKKEPMFDARKAAGIIRHFLVGELQDIQREILLVERFGDHAVTFAALGRMGTVTLPELIAKHDEKVEQIKALQAAGDKASEESMKAFVAAMKERQR